ncbi:MAG: DUF1735 domain-containing protein [Bacteroides sp.]|nr:DUF1735 domain-containing protein [Bacteroides sp.]
MKFIIKDYRSLFFILILSGLLVAGCKEGDGDADYGFAYIYMPQATVSGGLNNHYPVPSGAGVSTYNFKEENSQIHIYLGILRSGLISGASGFTVNVSASSILTEEAIASGEIASAMALPAALYTLPDKATVEPGQSSASFFLSVDNSILTDDAYAGKNLVLAVEISNPTQYELSDQNTSVVVVIDVEALKEREEEPED